MIKLTKKITPTESAYLEVSQDENIKILYMNLDMRIRSRQRAVLEDGQEVGLFLERGSLIRGGDILINDASEKVKVLAADECVSTVYSDDALMLAKAAYHLGNRHVPLQIEQGWLRYQHDHVLDDMIQRMGLRIEVSHAPFEPEAGAYQQQGQHTHSHDHSHEREESHNHAH